MIVLSAAIAGALALFALGVSQVAVRDLYFLETHLAAQRAAEAAASRAANLIVSGAREERGRDAVAATAFAVASANVTRGSACRPGETCGTCTFQATATSSAEDLVAVVVTTCARYAGFAGETTAAVTARAAVPRPIVP